MADEGTVAAVEGDRTQGAAVTEGGGELLADKVVTTWAEPFSPEFQEVLKNDGIQDLQALERTYRNAQQMLGASIRKPSQDAGAEDWEKFYARLDDVQGLMRYDPENPETAFKSLGKPAEPGEYTWEAPENYEPDQGFDQDFARAAHEANLTQEQYRQVRRHLAERDMQADSSIEESRNQTLATLQKEWGLATEAKLQSAQSAVQFFNDNGFPGLVDALQETGAGDDPALIKFFEGIGRGLNKEPGTRGELAPDTLDPGTARQRLSDIDNNPDHPYWKGDPTAVDLYRALRIAAQGGDNPVVVENFTKRAQVG